jgi:hypothetical protein
VTETDVLVYAHNIIDAPDEWTPHYTRSELLPMARAYVQAADLAGLLADCHRGREAAQAEAFRRGDEIGRLYQHLVEVAEAWFGFDQQKLDALLHEYRRDDDA